jgi:hypothetical protein
MKAFPVFLTIVLNLSLVNLRAQNLETIRQMELSGDTAGARIALARAVDANGNSIPALTAYAEFLERYGDPECRVIYGKLYTALRNSGDTAKAGTIARRLAILHLLAGDNAAAQTQLQAHKSASGSNVSLPAGRGPANISSRMPEGSGTALIPGPFRSFARMAAISSEAGPEDVLPALARNVVTNGFQASHSNDALEQTEYLKLVHRYLSQARELEKLAGDSKTIKV